jgi:hypothetical protein
MIRMMADRSWPCPAAVLGKWNLGMWAKRYTPIGRGFDTYLGYLSADEQYYTHYKWPPFHGGASKACGYTEQLPSLYNITDLINGTDGYGNASFFAPFDAKIDHFTKTGSGQT